MSSPTTRFDPRRVRWQAGLLSGALYGTWAGLRNADAGWRWASAIGLTQLAVSFAATFLLSTFLLALVKGQRTARAGAITGLSVTCAYTAVLASAHAALGTPHPIWTISPIAGIAAIYAVWFSVKTVKSGLLQSRSRPSGVT